MDARALALRLSQGEHGHQSGAKWVMSDKFPLWHRQLASKLPKTSFGAPSEAFEDRSGLSQVLLGRLLPSKAKPNGRIRLRKSKIFGVVLALILCACTAEFVPSPNLSSVEVSDPISEVAEVLGNPIRTASYPGGQLIYFSYQFTRGTTCGKEGMTGDWKDAFKGGADPISTILLLPIIMTLDSVSDAVVSHEDCETIDAAMLFDTSDSGSIIGWVAVAEEKRSQVWNQAKQAAAGNADAQFQFSKVLEPQEAELAWLERAAQRGNTEAAQEMVLVDTTLANAECAESGDLVEALSSLRVTQGAFNANDEWAAFAHEYPWLLANADFWIDVCRKQMSEEQIDLAEAQALRRQQEIGIRPMIFGAGNAVTTVSQHIALLQPGDRFEDCDDCPEMAVVPPGRYRMGTSEIRSIVAYRPEVTIEDTPEITIEDAFAVSRYEVTFAEWDACVASGGCNGYTPDDNGWGRGRRPVINVSWIDAQNYVAWLSERTGQRYRLLTAAEWEYAARAGTNTPFHFGSTISFDQANFNATPKSSLSSKGTSQRQTVPVGSFPGNRFYLHDFHGNVSEWVEDCWIDRNTIVSANGYVNQGGVCKRHVTRGGSYSSSSRNITSNSRTVASRGSSSIGFRVARLIK